MYGFRFQSLKVLFSTVLLFAFSPISPFPFLSSFDLIHDILCHLVKPPCRTQIQCCKNPRHEELRQREHIGEVHDAKDFRLHEVWCITHENWQCKIIHEKEDSRRDNKLEFRSEK